jgi:hypothetical protein
MKVYNAEAQVEKDIKDGVLTINGDVKFECSISISASIIVIAGNITAMDITAEDITARNITARNITAMDITAWNIDAMDITAWNITAMDILYYAFCGVYNSIKCLSIKAKREVHGEPVCLDGKLEIKKDEPKNTNPTTITIDGATYKLVEEQE